MLKASWTTSTPNLLILDSREAILALAPVLEALAERCGQFGAMHWLPYFLDPGVLKHRVPLLVLVLRPEQHQRSLCGEDVVAAALLFEYRVLGLRTGAVATGDAVGYSSVIAPAGQRQQVAAAAAQALLDRGAKIVLATHEETGEDLPERGPMHGRGVLWATRQREVSRTLPLQPTLDATLAVMGKRTRFNLRYYRRRLERAGACAYLPDAVRALAGEDWDVLNQRSLNPVPPAEFARRMRSAAELPDSFLSGLRGPDGEWLSLIGGWRQGGTTVLHWQANMAGHERDSIGTVMRSFFLEHEIERGATSLMIYGGTPHPMRHAFEQRTVGDLVMRRRGVQAAFLFASTKLFAAPRSVRGRRNFFASTLHDPQLQWRTEKAAARPSRAISLNPRHRETLAQ